MVIIKGLRDTQTDILAVRVYDPTHAPKPNADRPPRPKLLNLTPIILPNVDPESGEVRMLAVPEFQLNQTSQLRIAFWYPCYQRPEGVQMLLMPCFFQPLSFEEYVAGTTATSTHEGRRVVFHMRYHPPPSARSDSNSTAVPDISESSVAMMQDDVAPTTRVTCWLPERDALLKYAKDIKIEEGSHWAPMRALHYSERREGMFDKHEDPLPAVWYDYELVPHGEVEVPPKDVLIHGRKYCRSWLWITVPETYSYKWLIHHHRQRQQKEQQNRGGFGADK